MKNFEIWLGRYNLGQGMHGGETPEKVADITAISFKVACIKYELLRRLRFIESCEKDSREEDIVRVGLTFTLDVDKVYQPWIGYYYQSEEEALKTF